MPGNTKKQSDKAEVAYAKRVRVDLVRLAIRKGKGKRLREQNLRLAMYLLGKLDYKTPKHIPLKEIAHDLSMQPTNVSKTLKEMRKIRLLADSEKSADDARQLLRKLFRRKST